VPSPLLNDGVLYLLKSNAGILPVADDERVPLDDGFDASPALVDNDLYLRGNRYLYCIAEQ